MPGRQFISPLQLVVSRRGKELHLKVSPAGIACWPQAEVGRRLGVHRTRVYQLIREGKLSTIEVRGKRYVTDASVRIYEESALLRQLRLASGRKVAL